MAVVSERVLRMKKNFMELHQKGYSIPEIAELHDLSAPSVYRHLQEIADENGVKRDDLLKIIKVLKSERFWKEQERRVHLDVAELKESFAEAEKTVDKLVGQIDDVLNKIKEDNNNV